MVAFGNNQVNTRNIQILKHTAYKTNIYKRSSATPQTACVSGHYAITAFKVIQITDSHTN